MTKATPGLRSPFSLHSSCPACGSRHNRTAHQRLGCSPRMLVHVPADTWSCMLEVKWEFQGIDEGRTVQGTVEKIVRRLQRGLGAIVCPVHRRSPRLRVAGSSLSSLDIGVETCCRSMMDETTARIHDIRKRGKTRALARTEMRHPAVVDQRHPARQIP